MDNRKEFRRALTDLQGMRGHAYLIAGKPHRILVHRVEDNDTVQVTTDQQLFFLSEAELPAWVEGCAPLESTQVSVINTEAAQMMAPMSGALGQLTNILLDNITKVQANPEYIPQATAIKDQVQTFIGLARVQVDAARVMIAAQNQRGNA